MFKVELPFFALPEIKKYRQRKRDLATFLDALDALDLLHLLCSCSSSSQGSYLRQQSWIVYPRESSSEASCNK